MLIHYGQCADGREEYSDDVDCLSCEIVRYTRIECDSAEQVVRVARLNGDRFGTPWTVQVGDVFAESEDKPAHTVTV